MANLTVSELLRFDWRIENFLRKYKSQEKFEMSNGQKVSLVFDDEVYDIIKNKKYTDLAKAVFQDSNYRTKKYRITSFKKTEEFGGIPERVISYKDYEMKEAESINTQMDMIRAKTGNQYVSLRIKEQTYNVVEAVKSQGSSKSNIHFVDTNGNEIVWLSHKKGYLPSQFSQWSDLREFESYSAVKRFIEDIKEKYPNGVPRATIIGKKIDDEMIKMRAVYGKDYTGKRQTPFGKQNVNVVIQGPTKIIRDGIEWKLVGHNTFENGKKLTVSYEPIFICFHRSDSDDFGLKGTRFAIIPTASKRIDVWL